MQAPPGDKTNYPDIASIDARLAEIELEKHQLTTLKQSLLSQPSLTPTPSHRPPLSTSQKITIFKNLFRGRTDIFATRWQNRSGKKGYSVSCNNEWIKGICQKPRIKCQDCKHRQFTQLNDQIYFRHLSGQQVVGVYPLLQDNSCYFLAADFDKGNWRPEITAMAQACSFYSIPYAIEISHSGNGAHLWIFFENNVPAMDARLLGFGLLDKAMEFFPTLSFNSYDRLFPNQDILPEGGFGNLIALPLQKEARQYGNTCFVDDTFQCIRDQWGYLSTINKVPSTQLAKLLESISPNRGVKKLDIGIGEQNPWDLSAKPKTLKFENSLKTITVTLANHIYFSLNETPKELVARLRRLATFANPVFFKTQALRFSTHSIPRFISCAHIEQNFLSLPRGCLDDAVALLAEHKIAITVNDKRQKGREVSFPPLTITLRNNQQKAVKAMLQHDSGILHAPTAFGKTVTAIAIMAKRKANTLILVHSRQLLDQWQERLQSFMPGLEIGVIGGNKKIPTGIIDIATYQSLINKKENTVLDLVQEYGHVIIDECHHLSAPRFEMVLNEVRAKYTLGLTATPERQDGHQKIIFMAAGPIRHKVKNSQEEAFKQTVLVHNLLFPPPEPLLNSDQRPKISDAYRWILENNERTHQIIKDVQHSLKTSQHPIVLTERREHAQKIHSLLLEKQINSVVLKGGMRSSERKKVETQLPSAQVVVATGKYVGEGFDLPRLDTLFLAMPIAWKGSLAQYAGRIHRVTDNKVSVTIHDYVDSALPMLERMYRKREKSYKAMGYKIELVTPQPETL